MSQTRSPMRRSLIRTVRVFAVLTAVSGLALTAATRAPAAAARAQAAAAGPAGRAPATRSLSAPAPIPLNTANWSGSAGFGSRSPAWYTDKSGLVHLQGAVTQTSTSGGQASLVGTLPKAARPAHVVTTLVHSFSGTYAVMSIGTNGTIFVSGPPFPAVTDLSFVSLEGIIYRHAGTGTAIALNTINWSEGGGTFPPATWYTDGSGVIHLQGAVAQTANGGSSPNLIGTLPPAARPAATVFTIVLTTGGYADLGIQSNGQLVLIDPRPPAAKDYSFVSLESISYRRADTGNLIPVNTANWSRSAGFGSRTPRWYADKSGIVHLEGAVRQTSSSGPGANLIGTLPAAARPAATVYTIVHTFSGTYADLAIEANGQLALIDPRPPMVKDYTFVSLESLTYRR